MLFYFKILLKKCKLSIILKVIDPKIADLVVNVHFRHQTGAMQCKPCGPGSSCSWLWASWSTGLPQHKPPRWAPRLMPLHCVFCCSCLQQCLSDFAMLHTYMALLKSTLLFEQQCTGRVSLAVCFMRSNVRVSYLVVQLPNRADAVHLSADFAVRILCAHRGASVPSHCWMEWTSLLCLRRW